MRDLFFSLIVFLLTASPSLADQLQTKLLASAGLNSDMSTLFPAIKRISENGTFNLRKVKINEACSERDVCIYVIDIGKLEASLKLRYARYFDKLDFNMISVPSNTILIDANLIRIQTTDLYKNVGLLWQLNNVMGSNPEGKDALFSIYTALGRKQAYDMSYIAWAPEAYLDMLQELRETITAPNKDEIITLSFAWQLLHELGHIKQFSGANMNNHAPLAFSLFDIPRFFSLAERTRRLEKEADNFADNALPSVLAYVRKDMVEEQNPSDEELFQQSLPEVALISSVEGWRAHGISRIFGAYLPLRFDDQFLRYEYMDCDNYKKWLSSDAKSLPEQTGDPPRILFTIADGVIAVKDDIVLIDQAIWGMVKARYQDLKERGVYTLEEARFQQIIEIASENFFGAVLQNSTDFEEKVLSGLEREGFPEVTRRLLGRPTSVRIQTAEQEWMTVGDGRVTFEIAPAINCSDDLICSIYTFAYDKVALGFAEVVVDRTTGLILSARIGTNFGIVLRSGGDDEPDDGKDEWRLANAILKPLLENRTWLLQKGTELASFPDKFTADATTSARTLKLYRAAVNSCNHATITVKSPDGEMLLVNDSHPYGLITFIYKMAGSQVE